MKLGTVSQFAAGSKELPTSPLPVHPVPKKQAPATVKTALQAAAQINEFLKSTAASVEFTVDGTSQHVIVRVVDSETNQVIRQIPSEQALAISHALDRMTGLLLEQKA